MSDSAKNCVFSDFLAPMTVEQFLGEHWPDKPWVRHGSNDATNSLIAGPEFRSPEAFCAIPHLGISRIGNRWDQAAPPRDNVDSKELLEGYESGNSVIFLGNIDTGPIRSLRKAMDQALGLPPGVSKVNAFMSTDGPGLDWHWDPQEIFLLQVSGSKTWRFSENQYLRYPSFHGTYYESPSDIPRRHALELDNPEAGIGAPTEYQEVTTNPGDIVFLPRGHWHRVMANEGMAIHLVLVAQIPCWRDVLQFLLNETRAFVGEEWRSPIPGLGSTSSTQPVFGGASS